MSAPSATAPSVLEELYRGRVRWDVLQRFPAQDPADRIAGEETLASLEALLRGWIDPLEVDDTGELPDGFLDVLRDGGFLSLTIESRLGGRGLSLFNAFRVVELAASRSAAVAYTLAVANGFGSGSYLPVLPDGPLRDMIAARVAGGIVSGGADAEATGTANGTRTTVALPVDGGTAYEISGEKVFIGNGPVADLVDVSATLVAENGTREVRLFFVDTRASGFTVTGRHEFMGLRGALIGALRLESVRVPAENLLDDSGDGWRMRPDSSAAPHGDDHRSLEPPDLARLAAQGRILVIGPLALALAKLCLVWSRDFVGRRTIDGRNLGEYEAIQRLVATTAADAFTIETVCAWALLGQDRSDTRPELTAAKNLTSLACWRAVDRTLSLLGGEGYETAASKARRGVAALPVERAFRDARSLRVAGGVDFMLDAWAAQSSLSSCYYDAAPQSARMERETGSGSALDGAAVPARCREHASFVDAQARALAELCARLTSSHTRDQLFARQRTTGVIGRIANELLSMALVLARAADLTAQGNLAASDLADVACAASRRRLDALWPQLGAEPDYASLSAGALHGDSLDFLLTDVLLDPAPRPPECPRP